MGRKRMYDSTYNDKSVPISEKRLKTPENDLNRSICCIICRQCLSPNDECQISSVISPSQSNQPEYDFDLMSYLTPFYFLQNLVGYPPDKIANALQTVGDPPSWFQLCRPCSTIVNNGMELKRNMTQLQKQLTQLEEDVRNKVIKSLLREGVHKKLPETSADKLERDIRRFIAARTKPEITISNSGGVSATSTPPIPPVINTKSCGVMTESITAKPTPTSCDKSSCTSDLNLIPENNQNQLELLPDDELLELFGGTSTPDQLNLEFNLNSHQQLPSDDNNFPENTTVNINNNPCENIKSEVINKFVKPTLVLVQTPDADSFDDSNSKKESADQDDLNLNDPDWEPSFDNHSEDEDADNSTNILTSSQCDLDQDKKKRKKSPKKGKNHEPPEDWLTLDEIIDAGCSIVNNTSQLWNLEYPLTSEMIESAPYPTCTNRSNPRTKPLHRLDYGRRKGEPYTCPFPPVGSSPVTFRRKEFLLAHVLSTHYRVSPWQCQFCNSPRGTNGLAFRAHMYFQHEKEPLLKNFVPNRPPQTQTDVVKPPPKKIDNWPSLATLFDAGYRPFIPPLLNGVQLEYPLSEATMTHAVKRNCFSCQIPFGKISNNLDTTDAVKCPFSDESDEPYFFRRPEYLMAHLLKHHFGITPWNCSLCCYKTQTTQNLRVHLKQHINHPVFEQLRENNLMPLAVNIASADLKPGISANVDTDDNPILKWLTIEQLMDSGRSFLDVATVSYPLSPEVIDHAVTKRCRPSSNKNNVWDYGIAPNGSYICPFSNLSTHHLKFARKFSRPEFLVAHMLSSHYKQSKPWKCDICPKSYRSPVSLRTHLFNSHVVIKSHPCPHCYKRYRFQSSLNNHVVYRHKSRTNPQCDICSETFPQFKLYIAHLQASHPDFEFASKNFTLHLADSASLTHVCEMCPANKARYGFGKQLRFHQVTRHGACDEKGEFLKCDRCGDYCSTEHNMELHMQLKHNDDERFCCDKCPQTFKSPITLDNHTKRHHLGRGSGPCLICGVHSLNISLHKSSHHSETLRMNIQELKEYIDKCNEEEKLKCTKCSETFGFRTQLFHHLKVAHRTNKFKCEECGSGYASRSGLKRHVDRKHLNTTFTCEFCKKDFGQEVFYSHRKRGCNVRLEMEELGGG